jgi:hypothetical protein
MSRTFGKPRWTVNVMALKLFRAGGRKHGYSMGTMSVTFVVAYSFGL